MLETVVARTNEYIAKMPKQERKRYGQFFTSLQTARFMVEMYDLSKLSGKVKILDAGAGSGILACALLERLSQDKLIEKIELVCYENDEKIISLLEENLLYCQQTALKQIGFEIRQENYR